MEKQVNYCWLSVPLSLLIVGLLFQIWKDSRFFLLLHCCSLETDLEEPTRHPPSLSLKIVLDLTETCGIAMECLLNFLSDSATAVLALVQCNEAVTDCLSFPGKCLNVVGDVSVTVVLGIYQVWN